MLLNSTIFIQNRGTRSQFKRQRRIGSCPQFPTGVFVMQFRLKLNFGKKLRWKKYAPAEKRKYENYLISFIITTRFL